MEGEALLKSTAAIHDYVRRRIIGLRRKFLMKKNMQNRFNTRLTWARNMSIGKRILPRAMPKSLTNEQAATRRRSTNCEPGTLRAQPDCPALHLA
jgi:hypothetical protein